MILEAPYGLNTSAIFLPNPVFNDSLGLSVSINQKVSLNNTRYTYRKTTGRKKLNYTFDLPLKRALELREFVNLYLTHYIKLTNHKEEVWQVLLMNDAFSFNFNFNDRSEINLLFEGKLIYAKDIEC